MPWMRLKWQQDTMWTRTNAQDTVIMENKWKIIHNLLFEKRIMKFLELPARKIWWQSREHYANRRKNWPDIRIRRFSLNSSLHETFRSFEHSAAGLQTSHCSREHVDISAGEDIKSSTHYSKAPFIWPRW